MTIQNSFECFQDGGDKLWLVQNLPLVLTWAAIQKGMYFNVLAVYISTVPFVPCANLFINLY